MLLQDINLASQVGLDDNGYIHFEIVQKLDHIKAGIPEPDLLQSLGWLCFGKHVVFHILHKH